MANTLATSQRTTEKIDVINLAAYLLRHHIRVIGSSVTWGVDVYGKPDGGKLSVTLSTERKPDENTTSL